jgi:hypothetical protein
MIRLGELRRAQRHAVHGNKPLVRAAGLDRRIDLVDLHRTFGDLAQSGNADLLAPLDIGVLALELAVRAETFANFLCERARIGQRANVGEHRDGAKYGRAHDGYAELPKPPIQV